MSDHDRTQSIDAAFSEWTALNDLLIDVVGALTSAELARSIGPDRWPIWAVVGHAACQRVFWLCDFAGEPGAASTRFTEAAWNCPGDDDLDNVLGPEELVDALTSTFAIVSATLSGWTFESLEQQLQRPDWGGDWSHTRGAVIQRVHNHDVWHAAEVNEALTTHGHSGLDPWT